MSRSGDDIRQLLCAESYVAVNLAGDTNTVFRGLYVGNAGDVRVLSMAGQDETWTNLAAGVLHPISGRKVFSSANGTTATGVKMILVWDGQ